MSGTGQCHERRLSVQATWCGHMVQRLAGGGGGCKRQEVRPIQV